MTRKVVVSLALILGFLGIGSFFAATLVKYQKTAEKVERVEKPLPVHATTLTLRTMPEPLVGFGTARADVEATLTAEVGGEVIEIAETFKPGAPVRAGQLLIRINEADYREQLHKVENLLAADDATLRRLDVDEENLKTLISIATAELAIADREHRRMSRLHEQDAAASREFDVAESAWNAARRALQTLERELAMIGPSRAATEANKSAHEADLALARLALDRTRIEAPFDGEIVSVHCERGELLMPGQPIVRLLDPRLIEVPIRLPAASRPRISQGARATLSQDSLPGVAWTGQVVRISPVADQMTRTFELYVEVDNAAQVHPLSPGSFLRAQMEGDPLHDILAVPRGAIRDDRVFVAVDGKARPRRVTVERTLMDEAVVRGVSPGDVVITTNLDALYDGAPVSVTNGRFADAEPEPAGHAANPR